MPKSLTISFHLVMLIGLVALYALLAKLTQWLFPSDQVVDYLWPATAVALVAVLSGGYRLLPAVFIAALLGNWLSGMPPALSLLSAMCHAAGVLLGVWLTHREGRFDPAVRQLGDYLRILILALVVGLATATVIQLSLPAGSTAPSAGMKIHTLKQYWAGNSLGIILTMPLILVWRRLPREWMTPRASAEAILILGLSFLVGQVVFLDWLHDSLGTIARGYWMYLLITWAAVRLGPHGAVLVLAVTSIQALVGAQIGTGFFNDDIAKTQLANYLFYMLCLSVSGMSLATYFTERKAAEEKLRKLSLAVEQSPESIVITSLNAKIEYVNEAFIRKTGFSREEIIGANPRILHSGKTPAETFGALWDALTHGRTWKGEFHNRRKDGSEYFEQAIITPIRQPDGRITHYVAVKEDITDRKAAEEKINTLAFYDPLTSLPNRRLLLDRLQLALASSSRSRREGALLFIDLDNFKTLNDTLGHDIGDLLLEEVAQRLSSCIREGDTVARLGGDEFVVMLEDLNANAQDAAAQAKTVGEKIIAALNQPYQLAGFPHHSTASIGVTLFADRQETVDDLLKRADLAMYQAKAAGRNALRFFDPEMQAAVTSRAKLEADLRDAVLQNRFMIFYQPQVVGDRLIGAEALLRWQHPERGMVSPAEFIPLAEDTGLILPLGHWVLQTACGQLALWAARPEMAHLTIAVNVSSRQLKLPYFVEEVLAIIEHNGANPQRLKLELTESLLVDDVEDVIAKMAALKVHGVGFSLDDFGTGYSSLSYLKRLPLDQLKIDQGFVRDILTDPNDAAIAKMIVALAESMGLAVIAEGVEIEAQRDFLAHNGCHAYQGYLFSRPLPLDKFEEYAKNL